jgi:hypothetical protein
MLSGQVESESESEKNGSDPHHCYYHFEAKNLHLNGKEKASMWNKKNPMFISTDITQQTNKIIISRSIFTRMLWSPTPPIGRHPAIPETAMAAYSRDSFGRLGGLISPATLTVALASVACGATSLTASTHLAHLRPAANRPACVVGNHPACLAASCQQAS